jgi:hypothetical protein
MFGKKKLKGEPLSFNMVNLLVGIAREIKINPVRLVKNAIDFRANTKFINQMNEEIGKQLAPKPKKKPTK